MIKLDCWGVGEERFGWIFGLNGHSIFFNVATSHDRSFIKFGFQYTYSYIRVVAVVSL